MPPKKKHSKKSAPIKESTPHSVGRIDFPKTQAALDRAWIMKGRLEKRGYEGLKQWLMMVQMAYESGGFYSPVAIKNNNYAGIKWYSNISYLNKYNKGRSVPPNERIHSKDGSGNFYVDFPTIDDFLTTWIEYYLKNDKIGQGVPLNALTIPEEVKRLYYNYYYQKDEPTYTRALVAWLPVLQKTGFIPILDDLTYAASSKLYNGKDFMHTPVPAFHTAIPQRIIHAADTTEKENADGSLSPAFIASAAKQARRLLPGLNISNVLDSIAKQQASSPKIVYPNYILERNELYTLLTDTAVIKIDSAFRDNAYKELDKKAAAQKKQANSGTYNSIKPGYNYMPAWKIPSRGNGLPPEFQWLQNGFQNPAISVDTPGANIHAPAHKAATHHATGHHGGAKGKTKTHAHRTADVIDSDRRPVVINVNAPMCKIERQEFRGSDDAIKDLEPKIRTALSRILDSARASM